MISYCYSFLESCSASGHSRLHCTRIISACHKPDTDHFLPSIIYPRFHLEGLFAVGEPREKDPQLANLFNNLAFGFHARTLQQICLVNLRTWV